MTLAQHRSSPACTALSGALRRAERFSLLAPRQPFPPVAASTLGDAPRASNQWDRSLAPEFPSPAAVSAYANSVPGSTVPAWRFAHLRTGCLCPFDLSAPLPAAGLPQRPEASTPQTRCTLADSFFRPRGQSPLPFGNFWLPGDRSVRLVTRPSGPPSRGARFRSLPAARCFQRNHGSSFPIRYAPGGLLFLKPLGTFLTMNPRALSGQSIFCTRAPFSTSSFSCISNDLHWNRRESAVNKTCPGKDVASRTSGLKIQGCSTYRRAEGSPVGGGA